MNSIIKRNLISIILVLLIMIPFINLHSRTVNAERRRISVNDVTKNRNYGFISSYNKDINTKCPYNNYHTVAGNDYVTFNHPLFLHYRRYVKNNYGYKYGDPQSMVILPNGNLYILFNAGHGGSPLDRILKYNLKSGHLLKKGRVFHGGHGQGLSYNYKTRILWMCVNQYHYRSYLRGILPKGLILKQVNQKRLLPYGHHIYIHLRNSLGDNFSYDRFGNYWNVARNYTRNKLPRGSLKIYESYHGRLKLIRDLLHSSSACIQNLCYNPDTNRLYVVGNGCILSFPINDIRHLKNREIRVAIMNHHSEFEGMGFWHHRAYLLVHPNRILRSNKEF